MNQDIISKRQPWIYSIELTNRCPMKCVMCARTEHMTRPLGDMSYELFTSIIDQLNEVTPDHFREKRKIRLHHFGESLLHEQFDQMVNYAASKGFKVDLSINPLMLKDDIIDKLLSSDIYEILMSLDGHDNESFYQIRGVKDSFDVSVIRLKNFLNEKVRRNSSVIVKVSMIDFNLNRESIETMKEFWSNYPGVDDFRQKVFLKWDGSADSVNAFEDDETQRAAMGEIQRKSDCLDPWKHVSILWDGRVVPCCFDFDGKFIYGDINNESLIDIWNGEPIQEIRKEFASKNVSNPLCKDCEFCPGKIPVTMVS